MTATRFAQSFWSPSTWLQRCRTKLPPGSTLSLNLTFNYQGVRSRISSSALCPKLAMRVRIRLNRAASLVIPMPPKAATPPLPPRQQRRVANNANNEVWAQRRTHRRAGYDAIARDGRYYILRLLAEMPVAPDPDDRTVSKRAWEASVQHWREQLQRLYKTHNL